MLLDEFIDQTIYNSYEELKQKFAIHIPDDFNFAYDVVDRYAELDPQKEALVWIDDDEEKIFTFHDLKIASNKTANYLRMLGIKKGDAVMLILRRRYEFWFFLLALHRIGAIAVPATNMLLTKDIEYRTNAASIKAIVTYDDSGLQEQIEAAMPTSPSVKHLVTIGKQRKGWKTFYNAFPDADDEFERPEGIYKTCNNDIMLLYFTSGTSSYPKMVQHNYTYPLGHIVTAKYWQNVQENGRHLTIAETGWAKAMWGKIYGQWIAGSAVFTYDMLGFVPGKMLEVMSKYKITSFCAPPTVYRYLLQQDFSLYDLSALKYCTTAGEALNADIFNKFLAKTGLSMREGYGQTECTLAIGNFPWMAPRPGSMGKPAPGYNIDIIDANGNPCKANEVGEIVIHLNESRPFGLFAGYYRDQKMTESVFSTDLYHTGDTAWKDEDGYFWFVGRTDDLIKTSGYRVSPFEVESTLQQHPAVLECAVTGVNDRMRNQVVKATIVLSKGFEATKELAADIQKYTKQVAASYKSPRIIEFVSELPKTISGKIRRATIRETDNTSENEKNKDEKES